MQFSTQVPLVKYPYPLDYTSNILSLGSCFAENIGEKFDYFKFQSTVNLFGIIFNPVSIEKIIRRAVQKHYFTEADLFFHNEAWHCFDVHSELSHANKEAMLVRLNQILETTHTHITQSTHIIITLGTAWVYRHTEKKEIVANCHKVPQKQFTKELLSVEAIQQSLQNTIHLIAEVNANAKCLFTISPVRHIKDGFAENQRSKAHLITALHTIVNHPLATIHYFPSYEIMMDELRDYRFYAEDMLHPNAIAIQYIWEKFRETAISPDAFAIMEEVDAIQKALQHRPFNPNSEGHQKFLENLNQKIDKLAGQFPNMKF
jgi:hypothetical protein